MPELPPQTGASAKAPTPPPLPRGQVLLATTTALMVVASMIAGKAARDSILLAHFDVRSLPLFFGLSAVASLPVVIVMGRLMVRFGPLPLMPVLNAGSAVLAIAEWLLLSYAPRPIAVITFLHLGTLGAVLVSGFWSIVNERFDVQTGKKHIGRIGMGATLGAVLGGVLSTGTAQYLRTDAILLVLAGLQIVCALMLRVFGGPAHAVVAPVSAPLSTSATLGEIARSKLLRHVAVIVILGAMSACVMDYVFKASIASQAKSGAMLRSLSLYYTATSVVTALVQIALGSATISRLGIPRSVATLPLVVLGFGTVALGLPSVWTSTLARGAENVTRNSIYRAAYELLFAPLPEDHKRPTKVILDVGAERVGDMLGAQLVGAIVYFVAAPQVTLQMIVLGIALMTLAFAIHLKHSYTAALEQSLMARAIELDPALSWGGMPTMGDAGDLTALSQLHIRNRRPRRKRPKPKTIELASREADLRSKKIAHVQRALQIALEPELVFRVLPLLDHPVVGRDAIEALGRIAPRCTGLLVDALLDPDRELAVRRHLPAIIAVGDPGLATWGLWHGLADPEFEIRYLCGGALARLAAEQHLEGVSAENVFAAVRRELLVDRDVWDSYRLGEGEGEVNGFDHIFTVLGLVLPAEPLRVALRAMKTEDPALRGTAIEYLESILPPDVRAQLWPFLELGGGEPAAAAKAEAAAPPAPPAELKISDPELRKAMRLVLPTLATKPG